MMIGCDIDGVLADFNSAYLKALIDVSGRELEPTYTRWDWDIECGYTKTESNRAWEEHIIHSDRFWRKLRPLPGAREALMQLNALAKEGHGVYFITNRSFGIKPRYQTEQWLYEGGMDYPAVILAAEKAPILGALGIQWYIDDRLDTMNDLQIQHFRTKHYYLLDQPYNRVNRRPDLLVVRSIEEALRRAELWRDTPIKSRSLATMGETSSTPLAPGLLPDAN